MALPKQYLTGKHNDVENYFSTIFSGQAPDTFSIKFLNDLGFKSSYDRQFIGVLKALGFLEDSGIPTKRYYEALDQSNRQKLVADGIKEAYNDLFMLDRNAQTLDISNIKGKFKTITEGKPADTTINHMAKTFRALCDYADWSTPKEQVKKVNLQESIIDEKKSSHKDVSEELDKASSLNFKYDIHIHLPPSRDTGVYDALFTSLKKHLMN